jgi:hypothetical protein
MHMAMLNSPEWLESIQSYDDLTEDDQDRLERAWDELKAELLRRGGDPELHTL